MPLPRFSRLAPMALLVPMLACSPGDDTAGRDPTYGDSNAALRTMDSTVLSAESAQTAATPGVPTELQWEVTPRGVGPVQVGMTYDVLRTALSGALAPLDTAASCTFVRPTTAPGGVQVMMVDGRVARVQVDSGLTPTAEGARIGSSEAQVQELYGAGHVAVTPHKYASGHYLTVTPAAPADSAFRLIFETDGQRVTRYRAGQLPEVGWVEGCS